MQHTLYIHVGPHKTGTTLIQKFLMDNRAKLFGQGLVYPKRFQTIFAHHQLRNLIYKKQLSKSDIQLFLEPHNFLVSSEDFISLEKSHWEYLQSLITNKRIVILYTWRRASLKLYSIWQETIKHGGLQSFFSYYHDHIARPGQSLMLSADLKLNSFAKVFSKENIRVLDYENSTKQHSLVEDFCRLADISWQDNFDISNNNVDAVNKSMDLADIEVLRVLNHYFKDVINTDSIKVKTIYLQNIDKLNNNGLLQIKQQIQAHCTELTVGNYYVDNRCEKVMQERFKDNILNYRPNAEMKKVVVATDEWFMKADTQHFVNQLVQFFRSLL